MQASFPARKLILAFATLAMLAIAPVAGVASATAKGKGHEKPNVLVVMTDDMAASDVELMPNVRKLLVKKGTMFENAITNFSLCCPSRATFLTGQLAHNHGVVGNFWPYGWYGMGGRNNTIASWLDDEGYDTAMVGKWLNGYGAKDGHGEVPAGFDTWRGLLDVSAYDYYNYVLNKDGKLKTWGDPDFAAKLVEMGHIQTVPNPEGFPNVIAERDRIFGPAPYDYWGAENADEYSPDVTGKLTDKLLRKQKGSKKPFFMWWSPAAPHREDVATSLMGRPGPDPRPPKRYADDVARLELPTPPNFNEEDFSDKPSALTNAATPLSESQVAGLREDFQGRAGSLMAVDDYVGEIVDTLADTGQLKDTVIMFLSDNGWLQGQHRIPGDKFLPYEESLRVPLIMRGPGIPKGQTIETQVTNADLAPTIVDLTGAKADRKMDGISLLDGMKKPKKLPERVLSIEAPEPLFSHPQFPVNRWDRPYSGVRTDRYTYVAWEETGEVELYDRRTDPYQLTNVASDPAYAEVRAELAAKAAELRNCRGKACNSVAP
ncbi:MAG TPA: sulfatase [Solirubrobacterales bacterium]